MRARFLSGLAALVLTTSPALAHDFWLQPRAFQMAVGGATPLTIQVGHGGARQRSPIRKDRIVRFEALGPEGRLDLSGDLHPGETDEDGRLRLPAAGQYVVILTTDDRAESHLPAERFNLHLETEGLTNAQELRRQQGREAADGSERYSRVAKAIVQVGTGGAATSLAPLDLPLEIVPEADPYALGRSSEVPVRVYQHERPLAGALVKLTDLAHDAAPVETHRTDAAGRARFQVPPHGAWLLTVVSTRPLPSDAEVDFETVFSSLSLGDR
ncbi:DUF4198 domain-containing protein [Caulobacter sp. 1776]|uniref:DUF4198 domain-containing protein n=1 Tax=Caulobacter sp. 1776 TaxID=3156420 RepID=UPI0033968EF6